MRLAYVNETDAPITWGVSYGLFATGGGSTFTDSFDKPLHILQLESTRKMFGGLDGHYRLYGWHTGQGTVHDGSFEKQSGLGVSVDQRVGDGVTLWGRYGHSLKGDPMYDRAVTLGANFSGSYWNRAADSLGVAVAHLAANDTYRATLAEPADSEQTVELFYNWRATPSLVLTPDLQFIRHAAADKANGNSNVVGLRAALSF
jgi:carbohydrate-selective porin OprB